MALKQIIVIDQGTTSSRAILFDSTGKILAKQQRELKLIMPQSGWVEQDPEEIWQTTKDCCLEIMQQADKNKLIGMGIANQRETTLIWERHTGKCVYNAIVWQDRRTADYCASLKSKQLDTWIYQKTGLLIDPYFCASKIYWLLSTQPQLRERAKRKEILFGTIDSFLLWRLTKGKVHATDITNAARTLLFNINDQQWDTELLDLFDVPHNLLPNVLPNDGNFGFVAKEVLGVSLPILAMVGDQQAAMMGQHCLQANTAKCTYGTGCFFLMNTGRERQLANDGLLTTIAYKIQQKTYFALEGSIFAAGSILKWLKEGLGFIHQPQESETIARSLASNQGVYLVPAFTGLGAPYWQPNIRGCIYGLSRDTTSAHIVRAGLEAMAYQTKDLLVSTHIVLPQLRVDGGVTANTWLMQFLADMLGIPIIISTVSEATALGVALLVSYLSGQLASLDSGLIHQAELTYYPEMSQQQSADLYKGWQLAIKKCLA